MSICSRIRPLAEDAALVEICVETPGIEIQRPERLGPLGVIHHGWPLVLEPSSTAQN